MNDDADQPDDDGFAAVLAEFLTRLDRGEEVCRETFLQEHPQHAAALRDYFLDVDVVEQLYPSIPNSTQLLSHPPLGEFGDYELLNVVGRGGTGIVYRARQRTTNQVVALKMLLHGLLLSTADVQRFRNETATAAALDHPHIVPIYDAGESKGHLYFTMPLFTGGSLARRVIAGPTPARAAAELVLVVAEAVEFAHQHGVIHRDLKPANVLLDEQGSPHISDFGLARQLAAGTRDITRTGELLGTPNYMAPEQVMGNHSRVGPAVDIYALGAMLYALLVGRPPFHSQLIAETLHKICSADPVPPRHHNPKVPPSLETICLNCLEKSPDDRYSSAAELITDLRRFQAGERPIARRTSGLEYTRRWFVRNPVIGSLALGIAAALVAGTVISLYYAVRARHGERQALASLYAADMNLAQQHLRAGAVASALQLLERHYPADIRGPAGLDRQVGRSESSDKTVPAPLQASAATVNEQRATDISQPPWEWRYLWHKCHCELRRFEGPHAAIYVAAFSPDGRTVAAGGDERTIWVWDTATGSEKFKLTGHTAAVRDLAFAPDGRQFATVGEDGTCRIWDSATGKPRMTLSRRTKPLTSVAISADGRFLATAGSDLASVDVWELATGKLSQALDLGPAESVAFAPAAARLAIAGRDGCVRVCECDEVGVWATKATIRAHAEVVRKVAWSPDGARLASAGSDNKVKTWDSHTWTKLMEVTNFRDAVYCLAFRPDGQRLVMAARNEPVKIWDLTQQQLVAELAGHSALVTSATFCPQGWRLLSASEDGTVRLWDAAQSTDHDCLEGSFGRVKAVDFSPDGRTLATGTLDGCEIILWDVQASMPYQVLHSQWQRQSALDFSPNGKFLASVGQNRLQTWNIADKKLVLDLELPGVLLAGVAWAPTGDRIAVQDDDGTILILDAMNGAQLATWCAPSRPHGGIVFSPDGFTLVTTGWDGVVRVWDVATRTLRRELIGHSGPVVCIAYSPHGSVIASSAVDDTIRLWDAKSGRHLRTLVGHSGTAMGLAFNADSSRLASCSTDQLVKLWDVATGLELQSLSGHNDWGLGVAFSPDSQTLASSGGDGTVRTWRAPNLNSPRQHSGEGPGEGRIEGSAFREATSLVKHLAARLTRGNQSVSDDPTTRAKLLALIARDPTISEAVRQIAAARAKDCLLYWPPMCEGHHAAQQGDWPQAIAAFERAAALAPHDISLWRLLALASAVGGDADAYEHARRELVDRFSGNAMDSDLANIVVATLLIPPNGRDPAPIKPLVETFAERSEIGKSYAVLYELRSGGRNRVADAVNSRQFKIPSRPEECFIMSLAWSQAGDKQRATALYEAGSRMTRNFVPTNWVAGAVSAPLQREAAAVLGIEPADIESKQPPITPIASPKPAPPTEAPR